MLIDIPDKLIKQLVIMETTKYKSVRTQIIQAVIEYVIAERTLSKDIKLIEEANETY